MLINFFVLVIENIQKYQLKALLIFLIFFFRQIQTDFGSDPWRGDFVDLAYLFLRLRGRLVSGGEGTEFLFEKVHQLSFNKEYL